MGIRAEQKQSHSKTEKEQSIVMAVASEGTSMEYKPTWALATVYFFFIFTAVFLRYSIHLLANVQLIFLGFASLLLAVTQDSISKFCIPAKLVDTMLPCRKRVAPESTQKEEDAEHFVARNFSTGAGGLYGEIHSLLADEAVSDSCSDGKVPFMKKLSLHQLHILIFVLAVMHIVYSVLTMALGRAKMRHTRRMEQQLSQSEVTSFSTEWSSMRMSLTSTEVPSNTRQASKPAQSIHLLSSRWEIKNEIVEQERSSSFASAILNGEIG
ncbi:Seven transmembrane MLO family protein [Prunus dulcis]|uniref:Seven transmembrane MLO family protein n=1 Tax=Prunus dulcis TaxID=3755 RepID=A0A4Y1RQ78_PRUDU|nr:Seven transmembrane MLO family protein [Prunus dulcis]